LYGSTQGNIYCFLRRLTIEGYFFLKETFVTQVNVAEDFQELLSDKVPELVQQFVRSKRALLENAFTEFVINNF
jgi:hypothetical protein